MLVGDFGMPMVRQNNQRVHVNVVFPSRDCRYIEKRLLDNGPRPQKKHPMRAASGDEMGLVRKDRSRESHISVIGLNAEALLRKSTWVGNSGNSGLNAEALLRKSTWVGNSAVLS